jgi:16S rRNA (guanine966-N2)-methyltransferase
LRIISGKYRGKKIVPPSGFRARPTTDYARESLFDILSNRYDMTLIEVLDLFSGTGSISYEFASRGSPVIHLVEKDIRNIMFIRKMIAEMNLENTRAIHIDVKAYLQTCSYKYDIVFADPPYELSWLSQLPDMVMKSGILKSDGIFILEHPKGTTFNSNPCFFEHRNYGNVNFSFFRTKMQPE